MRKNKSGAEAEDEAEEAEEDKTTRGQNRVEEKAQHEQQQQASTSAGDSSNVQQHSSSGPHKATKDDHNQASSAQDNPASSATSRPAKPRRPRPLRHPINQFVGVPLQAQIELAGVLRAQQPVLVAAGQPVRSSISPPKRPAQLPARFHRGPTQTSLGANVTTGSGHEQDRPNRYSWAQMQHWHARQHHQQQQQQQAAAAAAVAAAAAAAGEDPNNPIHPDHPHQGFHYHFPSQFSSAASRVFYVNHPLIGQLGAVNFQHTKSRLIKFIEALKRFSEKWFSHVLLLMFLAVYACLGAYVFISFEAPTEQWEKQQIIELRSNIVNESYEAALGASSREAYQDTFRRRFEDYERLLNRVCQSGMTSSSLENQWTFWGALFYSMTVFTTIGYGHLTPITFAGRVATMVYAIFGIPILLMVLADLGKLLTRIIKFSFKKFNYIYNKLLGRRAPVRLRTQQLISDNTHQYFGVARDAFERGFAQYIQPYQNRLPSFGVQAASSWTTRQRSRFMRARNQEQQLIKLSERDPQLEASDVIVTPHKQTKPVSPPIDASASASASASATATATATASASATATATATTTTTTTTAMTANKKHKRSQSPASCKRKISSNNNNNKSDQAARKQKLSTVSRSSSATNMVSAPEFTSAEDKKTLSLSEPQQALSDDDAAMNKPEQQTTLGDEATMHVGEDSSKRLEDIAPGPPVLVPHSDSMDVRAYQAAGLDHEEDGATERDGDEMLEEAIEDEDDFDIPVSFALFLLITYMMAGAFVFSIWEGWNFFDALYFVFISMSTIGFGDLVPQHPKRMVGTFAYLLFGLALTSMCINVVQEKIHATFLRAKMQIGEKMGFDLDQIMAGDYYGDTGSAYGPDDVVSGATICENESIGVSSASGGLCHTDQQPAAQHQAARDQSMPPVLVESGLYAKPAGQPIAKSKSKDSLKSPASSSSIGGALSVAPGSKSKSHSSSFRRKSITGKSKQRQQVAAAAAASSVGLPASQVQVAPASGQPLGASQALKAQLETIRFETQPEMISEQQNKLNGSSINQPIESLRTEFGGPPQVAQADSLRYNLASSDHINGLSNSKQREEEEEEEEVEEVSKRDVATRAQTVSPAGTSWKASKSLDSSASNFFSRNATFRRTTAGNGRSDLTPVEQGQQQTRKSSQAEPKMSLRASSSNDSPPGRLNKPLTALSGRRRRASISNELSQLDGILMTLSQSPPQRFGPLLGVPASSGATSGPRPSRSVSPGHLLLMRQTMSASSNTSRRGTSMVDRRAADDGHSASERQKKRSLVSQVAANSSISMGTPHFLPNLIGRNNALNQSHSDLNSSKHHQYSGSTPRLFSSRTILAGPQLAGEEASGDLGQQRRKSSSSSTQQSRLNNPRGVGRQQQPKPQPQQQPSKSSHNLQQSAYELSLNESQAALDELEAVKFSAL